jgi:hypothetical protein
LSEIDNNTCDAAEDEGYRKNDQCHNEKKWLITTFPEVLPKQKYK